MLLKWHPRRLPNTFWVILLGGILSVSSAAGAKAQATSSSSQTSSSQSSQPASSQDAQKPVSQSQAQEIASHDSPATFKVRVNLVFVRVVVRDPNGKVIPNLKKEDFQLADNRKTQVISTFAAETPGSHVATVKMDKDSGPAPTEGTPIKPAELPQRFITLFFDDLHLATQDALLSRQAATKLFVAMQTGDRLAIFTSSGQVQQEFTADRDKLEGTLPRILPRPLSNRSSTDCPPMTLYEAYQIVEVNDPMATQVATQDAAACSGNSQGAVMMAQAAAQRELTTGEAEMQFSFRNLDGLIARMKSLPGQRIIVMMSPGYFVTPQMRESGDVIDRATKANIVINTIDARGLYVSSIYDASNSFGGSAVTVGIRSTFIATEESIQDDVLAELADGTGGTFFHNRNDIDQGLLQAAKEPEVAYVLGFTPQNLKLDGKYHHLKVTLTGKQKWNLQARHGYFAPRGNVDPETLAKEEIRQAVYSQEELQDLPVDCQTQFFKIANGVRLAVVAHITTKGLKFTRDGDRSKNNLTVATAIFDENGNLVTGLEKVIEMRLRDTTLEHLNRSGVSIKSTFDVQPGTFLVRVVVRDSEGAQMAAVNRGVVIPY
ncbi:MAG TPA: VWA domain-containing protein [Candidatus Acidoferrum sp.]|nr:VWA domain-containing protein [Candidatus Acidoferrum sp.]